MKPLSGRNLKVPFRDQASRPATTSILFSPFPTSFSYRVGKTDKNWSFSAIQRKNVGWIGREISW